jgi:hypothetical protein
MGAENSYTIKKNTPECLSEYSEAGGQSYVHRRLHNSLSYILEGLTVQELMSVVKCIVYLLNERKNLNKNAMHKERQILLTVNFRVTETHFHSLRFAQRCFRVSGMHYYKIPIPLGTSLSYAKKKFPVKRQGHER